MKHLFFGSLILAAGLCVGCGAKVAPPPPATEVELEQQKMNMAESMKAGEAAAKGGGAPSGSPSGESPSP